MSFTFVLVGTKMPSNSSMPLTRPNFDIVSPWWFRKNSRVVVVNPEALVDIFGPGQLPVCPKLQVADHRVVFGQEQEFLLSRRSPPGMIFPSILFFTKVVDRGVLIVGQPVNVRQVPAEQSRCPDVRVTRHEVGVDRVDACDIGNNAEALIGIPRGMAERSCRYFRHVVVRQDGVDSRF
jgi:hypothetical protein